MSLQQQCLICIDIYHNPSTIAQERKNAHLVVLICLCVRMYVVKSPFLIHKIISAILSGLSILAWPLRPCACSAEPILRRPFLKEEYL